MDANGCVVYVNTRVGELNCASVYSTGSCVCVSMCALLRAPDGTPC